MGWFDFVPLHVRISRHFKTDEEELRIRNSSSSWLNQSSSAKKNWRKKFSQKKLCGYWCRHRSKDCSKAHHLPSRAFTFWVGRVIPKNNLHHDHVCTDEFTQTGATRLLDSDLRRKMLKSTDARQPDQPNLVSRKHGKASGSQNLVFGKIKDAPSHS